MADKPNGVVLTVVKTGSRFNLPTGTFTPKSFTIDAVDSTTAKATVEFEINNCAVYKKLFTYTPNDSQAYAAYVDDNATVLDIGLSGIESMSIEQPTPGDNRPLKINIVLTIPRGKVGGAGAPVADEKLQQSESN